LIVALRRVSVKRTGFLWRRIRYKPLYAGDSRRDLGGAAIPGLALVERCITPSAVACYSSMYSDHSNSYRVLVIFEAGHRARLRHQRRAAAFLRRPISSTGLTRRGFIDRVFDATEPIISSQFELHERREGAGRGPPGFVPGPPNE
jgi:hypothetical protein